MTRASRHEPLPPEDDWFAEPTPPPAAPSRRVDDAPEHVSRPTRSRPDDRSRTLGIVGLVAVTIVVAGGVAVWALTGSSDGEPAATTTTTTVPTTPETTTTPTTPTTTPEQTTPTTPEPPNTENVPATVRQGDSGEVVRDVQQTLASLGYDVTVDGDFGEQTAAAVVAFQTASGLEADGVVGPATHAALAEAASGAAG